MKLKSPSPTSRMRCPTSYEASSRSSAGSLLDAIPTPGWPESYGRPRARRDGVGCRHESAHTHLMPPTDARFIWLSGLAVLIAALLLATALSALSQLVANASIGTTRPGHALATLHGTRELLAAMRSHIDELVASPCAHDHSRVDTTALEHAFMARAISHADTLGIDVAAAASLATLLTACTRQSRTSCREPSELDGVLMGAWVGAVAEWRQMDCAAAGSLAEEGANEAFAGSGVCGEAPWPRMLSAVLLSAVPCALPAVRTPRVGPFRVKDPS